MHDNSVQHDVRSFDRRLSEPDRGQAHGAMIVEDSFHHAGARPGKHRVDASASAASSAKIRCPGLLDNCNAASESSNRERTSQCSAGTSSTCSTAPCHVGMVSGRLQARCAAVAPRATPRGTGPSSAAALTRACRALGTAYDYIPHHAPFQYYPQTANTRHVAAGLAG